MLISFLQQLLLNQYFCVYLHIVLSEGRKHNILEYNKIL